METLKKGGAPELVPLEKPVVSWRRLATRHALYLLMQGL